MKLSFILCLLSALHLSASVYSQNTTLTLNLKNQTVKEILSEIESQSEFRFFYNDKFVDMNRTTTVNIRNQNIYNALDQLFDKTSITYQVLENNLIVITPREMIQQGITVRGTVTDKGEPIPGVNVVIKGASTGVISDVEGKYAITVPDRNTVLVFSFVGYASQEFPVGNQTTINVILEEEIREIEQVMVIGYGTMRKSDLTGSVSQVRSDMIENQAVLSDPIQVLQGKVAGLDITVGNKPGDVSSSTIRGYNSFDQSKNGPLIILDGVAFGGRMSDINPAEIEKIDVLKDASSTAIYGSRGSNGVIIITTKRAKMDGKISVSYDGYVGVTKSFKRLDMMSGDKWADFRRATQPTYSDELLFPGTLDIIADKSYIDWQEEMFSGTGFQTDNNLSINIGKEKMSNMIVLGYNKSQSIIDNMSMDRFSGRINGDIKLLKNVTMGYSAMFSHSVRDIGSDDWENAVFRFGTVMNPITRIYDNNGTLLQFPSPFCDSQTQFNPKYYADNQYLENKSFRNRAFFNLYAEWEIIDGLTYRTSFTPDWQFIENGSYKSPYFYKGMSNNVLADEKRTDKTWTFTNILSYQKTFGIHGFNVSLVQEALQNKMDMIQLTGENVPYYGKWYNVAEAPSTFKRESAYSEWSMASFMGRINYTLLDKYLFTVTGRYDGSSRLAPGHKWDFFPSLAFAWRIGSESFMESVDAISNLKLRLSWGNTGNSATDVYATSGRLGKKPYVFGMSDQAAIGYVPDQIPNYELGWEKLEEYNVGIDFGLFKNRVEATIDLYQRNTKNLLMQRYLPITSGYDRTWQNIGKTRNSGVEVTLNMIPVARKDFEWSVGLTFSYNKNEIVELYSGLKEDRGNKWFVGEPLLVELLYEFDGIWQLGEEEEARKFGNYNPGDPKIKDLNNSTSYDQEDQVIYNRIPKWLGGLNTTLRYKNFDFNMYLYTRQNYGQMVGVLNTGVGTSNYNSLDVDFWTPANPSNTYPKPVPANSPAIMTGSNYAFRDLSFVRLKNINLGYTFPAEIIRHIRANRLRAYIALDNPFVWTMHKLEALDPENCLTFDAHRPMTSFVFGINVTF